MKKYAIHPGYVVSKNDGDKHFIKYHQLIELYGVDPKECFEWSEHTPGHEYGKYTHLFPDYDGNYKVNP